MIVTTNSAVYGANSQSPFLGIADNDGLNKNDNDIMQRLDLFKRAGFGLLLLDYNSANPIRNKQSLNYFRIAKQQGFLLKLNLGFNNHLTPDFLTLNPDAKFKDFYGNTVPTISFWYPKLHELLEQYDDAAFAQLQQSQLLDSVAFILIPIGPAGEPIYPTPWTTGNRNNPQTFWWYDNYAIKNFAVSMQRKYGSIQSANAAWQSSYASWEQVTPPNFGQGNPNLWMDALLWYRDTKREFINWQIGHYKRLIAKYYPNGHSPQLQLYISGNIPMPGEFDSAAQSLGTKVSKTVEMMSDWDFVIQAAVSQGLSLDYSALPNPQKGAYIRTFLNKLSPQVSSFWGQNAGGNFVQVTPEHLAKCINDVLTMDMNGFELISSKDIIIDDGGSVKPSLFYETLVNQLSSLEQAWGRK